MSGAAELELSLPRAMGLDAAQAMLTALREAPADTTVALDASAVESMSTPGVLLLAALVRDRAEGATSVAVANPTPAFMDAFSDLGLFGDLMKMEFRT